MQKNDLVRLHHMHDAAEEAIGFARGRTRADLEDDRLLVLGLIKAMEIIGEAARQVSQSTRDALPDIPWDDIIGMRHRLVHAYFDINLDILWQTIQEDIPSLLDILKTLMKEIG